MINVINAGFYTTVQDLGRYGFQKYGVPVSGVMDRYSAILVNELLNNNENDAVLEITIKGPTLQFQVASLICISGADLSPKLNNIPVELNTPITVKKEDVLTFGKRNYGIRCYLAVLGGFQTNVVMRSRSMYRGITREQALIKNDNLEIIKYNNVTKTVKALVKPAQHYINLINIDVFKGPEFDELAADEKKKLLSKKFTISKENNRMAYQLNEIVENNLKPIITSLVLPGTVQLTPDGKLIVLMRDCQTTGGYPRVLQLSEDSINVMAQKFTNDIIHFELIDL